MITSYPMAKVTQAGQISWVDRTLPEFGSHDVLIQVRASAVCGSDLHIFKGKHPSAPLPAAIGHELAGEILSVGADVTRLKVGDRVTVEPVLACGHCYYCRRGQYHLCEQISFQYRRGQGGFTPYFVVNEERAFRLPANLDYAEGALVEPLSVALHAVKKANLRLGQSCAIFGAGAIGLMALMLARRSAAANIFVSDVHTFRLQKALELGAALTVNARSQDALQVIMDATQQMGVDHAFEAVGLETTLTQALNVLKRGGAATLLGIFETPQVNIPANIFVQREISLNGSQGYNWDFQDALTLLETGSIDLKPLITHRLKPEQLQEGFEMLLSPGSEAIKVVFEYNQ